VRVRSARDDAGADADALAAPGVPRRCAAYRQEDPRRGSGRGVAARQGLLPAARALVPLRPLLRAACLVAGAGAVGGVRYRRRQRQEARRLAVRAPPHAGGHDAALLPRLLCQRLRRLGASLTALLLRHTPSPSRSSSPISSTRQRRRPLPARPRLQDSVPPHALAGATSARAVDG
jgi:hypothetical protein